MNNPIAAAFRGATHGTLQISRATPFTSGVDTHLLGWSIWRNASKFGDLDLAQVGVFDLTIYVFWHVNTLAINPELQRIDAVVPVSMDGYAISSSLECNALPGRTGVYRSQASAGFRQ